MDGSIRRGLSQVFWNQAEGRLRAPLRLFVVLFAVLLFAIPLGLFAALLGIVFEEFGPLLTALFETLSLAALVVPVIAVIWFVDKRRFGDVGLTVDRSFRSDLLFGLTAGLLMATSVVLAGLLLGSGAVEGVLTSVEGDLFSGISVFTGLVVALGFFFVLAVLEELLFRGYLLVNIAEGIRIGTDDRTAVLSAVAVTAVLFGVAHAANPGASLFSTLNIVLFGLFLGCTYVFTDRLAVPIGIHTTWNYTLGPVFGLPVSGLTSSVVVFDLELGGPQLLTGGDFGPEGGLLSLLGLVVGVGFFLAWLRWGSGSLSIEEGIATPDLRS